ncbi:MULTISPECIES: hypothetical protein [unclassified Nocardioides]|uniref:hypothetical protein n=1 Tax=unclassified Nocardioides TaxID=2615069 RepID=UPI002665ED8B|nr:hypothetical protein [Nocardioides sp. Arc9.136]WKN47624.1 hypothetical protein OSR43_16485 [Nocardioides sp. Arc9.136]
MPLSRDVDREAWEVALDRLELDLVRVERSLGVGDRVAEADPWEVPEKYGPLPPDLRQRAEELVVRQQSVIDTLRCRMAATLRQRAVIESVGRTSGPTEPRAVYIDLTA